MAATLSKEQDHHIWYQSSSDSRDLSERVMDTYSDHRRTIIITVYDARYPITEDVLHKVFDPYGKVELIFILPTTKHFQATLRFQNHDSIKSAKIGLQGRNIYDGCCKLDLQYLATSFWDCESSKENAVGSMYNDIYELMKEMSSTIDNLISQLDKYKTSAAEKERKNIEHQVFDQLSLKKFMEFSSTKVDFHKFQSTLMKETVAEDTGSSNEDEKEASEVEDESDDKNAKRSRVALDKLKKAGEESFHSQDLKVIDTSVLEKKQEAGNDERAVELKKLDEFGVRKAADFAAGFASALEGLASNDIIQRTSGRLDSLHTDGISYLVYISATNLIRVLFDPGGYVVNTWKMSRPLNFGCVMVGVSDLCFNSLEELMVLWMHMNDILKFGESSNRIEAKWGSQDEGCKWKGVGCYNSTSHITAIEMGDFTSMEEVGVVTVVGFELIGIRVGDIVAYACAPVGPYAKEQILPVERVAQVKGDGCHHVILYKEDDLVGRVKEITFGSLGKGVDDVYDIVGNDTFDESLECLKICGCMSRNKKLMYPVMVKQIMEASPSTDYKSNFVIYGVGMYNVKMVGMVFDNSARVTDVSFVIAVGTGRLGCNRSVVNDPHDIHGVEELMDGIYVHIHGHLKSLQGKKQVVVYEIWPVNDYNEIVNHFIECVCAHGCNLEFQKNGFATPASSTVIVPNNEYQVVSSSQLSQEYIVDGLGSIDKMVLDHFQLHSSLAHEKGVHQNEIAQLMISQEKIIEIAADGVQIHQVIHKEAVLETNSGFLRMSLVFCMITLVLVLKLLDGYMFFIENSVPRGRGLVDPGEMS